MLSPASKRRHHPSPVTARRKGDDGPAERHVEGGEAGNVHGPDHEVDADLEAASISSSPSSPFHFIVGNRPEQLQTAATSRQLRSHLARRGWQTHLAAVPTHSRHGRRRRRRRTTANSFRHDGGLAIVGPLPMDLLLGGGRIDPFRSYPGPWRPCMPALADHYMVHMAADVPELDQPQQPGLLRSRWFPFVLSDPSAFAVILLLSAAHYASVSSPTFPPTLASPRLLLLLKQAAIGSINQGLRDPARRLSDSLVAAVAKMACFEALHGDLAAFRLHMDGLRAMLANRAGGLASLGLDGLLARIVLWIDLNASFLLRVDRSFSPDQVPPGVAPMTVPNPQRFLALE